MEKINITRIQNNLTSAVTITNDAGNNITLNPGEMLANYTQLTVPILSSANDFNAESYRTFTVAGQMATYAYIAVSGEGLISALGVTSEDFFPENPALVKITHEAVVDGDNLVVTFREDDLENGERITWVLGDHDDSL